MNNQAIPQRVRSIDILRALTMTLMIFVNDLWTLSGVPKWLLHAKAGEDYLGLSDIVFPLFLFIVGLSIPFAVANRRKKGDSDGKIVWHVFIRSVSLLIMGVFMVNSEYIFAEGLPFSANIWKLLMATAMVFIWMDWKRTGLSKTVCWLFQMAGAAILVYIAVIYSGGDGSRWMKTYWWGILGLIGWAYLVNALIFVLSKGKIWVIAGAVIIFSVLNILAAADMSPKLGAFRFFGTIVSGSIPALTAAGVLASVILTRQKGGKANQNFLFTMGLLAVTFLVYGFILRPYWGISKLGGTPSWVGICTGIGFASFAFFYWLADFKGISNWAKIIAPAGTATLSCYLVPYFVYPIRSLGDLVLPEMLREGIIGIVKSIVFALLVILLTGWFEKKKFKLKL